MHSGIDPTPHERLRRAEQFRDTSYLFAVGATHQLLDRLGTLRVGLAVRKHGLERWNLFVVSAGAFVVLATLEEEVPEAEFQSLKAKVFGGVPASDESHFLHLWSHNGTGAVEDCAQFVSQAMSDVAPDDAKQTLSESIGSWVLWNVLEAPPDEKDFPLVSALGHLIISSHAPYWSSS